MYTWYKRIPARRGLTVFGGRHLYQCKDGEWISFVVMPYRWAELVRWFDDEGIDSPVKSPEWRQQAYRAQHPGGANSAIQTLASRYTRAEMFHEGQRRLISIMPVNDVEDILQDAQLKDRGFFASYEIEGTPVLDAGPAARMSGTPLSFRRPAPRLGEHNREVFGEFLGLGDAEIADLVARGVI